MLKIEMSDSEESSVPPDAAGAGQHASAADALHPLWASAAGRGKGKGGRGPAAGRAGGRGGRGGRAGSTNGSDAGDGPGGAPAPGGPSRFFPISVADLEQRHRAVADGAESSLWSADEEEDDPAEGNGGQGDGHGDDGQGDGHEDDGEDGPGGGARRRRTVSGWRQVKRPRASAGAGDVVSDAVFGGAVESNASELSADDESSAAGDPPAERRLQAQRRAFHIRGVTCLGCSMERSQVDKVDQFVRENHTRLEQTALFKAASLYWKHLVVDPARHEGVDIPCWEWKNLRSHYLLHALIPEIQRGDCIRQLAAMRKTLEMSMLREDEDGNRGLDPKGSDLMLKLVQMQSKELMLLQSASMPPPPARAPGGSRSSGSGNS